jgi:hypothetical protein
MTKLNEKEKDFLKKMKEKLTLTQEETGLPMITLTQGESGLTIFDYNNVVLSLKDNKLIEPIGKGTEQSGYTIVELTILGRNYLQNHPNQ